jgi:hypothetical protein
MGKIGLVIPRIAKPSNRQELLAYEPDRAEAIDLIEVRSPLE